MRRSKKRHKFRSELEGELFLEIFKPIMTKQVRIFEPDENIQQLSLIGFMDGCIPVFVTNFINLN